MPALPLDDAGPYVAAAYLVFLALILIYVAIMATKLVRIERDISEISELVERREAARSRPRTRKRSSGYERAAAARHVAQDGAAGHPGADRDARRARGDVPARSRRPSGDPRGGRALHLQPDRALRRRRRPRRGGDHGARHARAPRRAAPDRADRRHLLAPQLRRRAPPVPRHERAGVDDRRRGRGAGPGQARLRGRAQRAHHRPAHQQAVPRRAGHRQARPDRHRDRRGRRVASRPSPWRPRAPRSASSPAATC